MREKKRRQRYHRDSDGLMKEYSVVFTYTRVQVSLCMQLFDTVYFLFCEALYLEIGFHHFILYLFRSFSSNSTVYFELSAVYYAYSSHVHTTCNLLSCILHLTPLQQSFSFRHSCALTLNM